MKAKKIVTLGLCSSFIFLSCVGIGCVTKNSNSSTNKIEVYGKPGDGVKESPYYSINVQQNGIEKDSFVYFSEPPAFDPNDPKSGNKKDGAEIYRASGTTQNWTTFSSSGKANVTVTKKDGQAFNTVRIIPTRYGITPTVSEDKKSLSFEINPTQKVMVEFDDNLKDRLYIFADPLENPELIPHKNDAKVFVVGSGGDQYGEEPGCLDGLTSEHSILYFPAGEFSIEQNGPMIEKSEKPEDRVGYRRAWNLPENIDQVYIEGGSIVSGGFFVNRGDVTFNGRGVISGKDLVYHQLNLLEFNANSRGNYFEGITLSDGVHFSLRAWDAHYNGENFKVIANWRYNNDGINVPENAVIKNCYLSGNDDTVKFYFGGSTLENCVIGQMVNGAVFQFGWGFRDVSNVTVKNIDILHIDGVNTNPNLGIINYRPRGTAPSQRDYFIQNIMFDGINVDNSAIKLIGLQLPQYQVFKDITIKNVNIDRWTDTNIKNYIKATTVAGTSGAGRAENFTFENIKINGKCLTDYNLETIGNFEPFVDSFISKFKYIYPVHNFSLLPSETATLITSKYTFVEGDEVVIQAIPNEGYEIEKISINGIEYTLEDEVYEISSVQEDITIGANFTIKPERPDFKINSNVTIGEKILVESEISLVKGEKHAGNEFVIYQLMKGKLPVSQKVIETDIIGPTRLQAEFDVEDPENPDYTVRTFILDSYDGTTNLPMSLADTKEGEFIAPQNAEKRIKLMNIVHKEAGDLIEISGRTYLNELVIKVITPKNTVLYQNVIHGGEFTDTFELAKDLPKGIYTLIIGKGDEVLTEDIFVGVKPSQKYRNNDKK